MQTRAERGDDFARLQHWKLRLRELVQDLLDQRRFVILAFAAWSKARKEVADGLESVAEESVSTSRQCTRRAEVREAAVVWRGALHLREKDGVSIDKAQVFVCACVYNLSVGIQDSRLWPRHR